MISYQTQRGYRKGREKLIDDILNGISIEVPNCDCCNSESCVYDNGYEKHTDSQSEVRNSLRSFGGEKREKKII